MDLLQLCSDKIAPPAQFRDTKKWENITTIEEWYETYPYFQQINFEFSCRRVPPFSVDITGSTLDGKPKYISYTLPSLTSLSQGYLDQE